MELDQLMAIAVSLSNRLDTHWTLFITVHLALIGGIIYVDRPLLKVEKLVAVFVYTGFALVNYVMMMNQMMFLKSIYLDIFTFLDKPCCQDLASVQHLVGMSQSSTFTTAMTSLASIHIVMYVLVVVSILTDKSLQAKTEQEPSEHSH